MSASWFCLLLYNDYAIEKLKNDIDLFLIKLKNNLSPSNAWNLDEQAFITQMMDYCGHLMSIQLSTRLFMEGPSSYDPINGTYCLWLDPWWKGLKCTLRQRYSQLSLSKEYFLNECIPNKTNNKTWSDIEPFLHNLVDYKDTCARTIDAFIHSITRSRVYDLQIHQICLDYYYDQIFEIRHDYCAIIHNIRMCVDNDITKPFQTFGEWLLSLLLDDQLFQVKLDTIHKYITENNINKAKFSGILRKYWANDFDVMNVPRGISTRLHKRLKCELASDLERDWSSNDIAEYCKAALSEFQRCKKIQIIENIQKEKIGKREFIRRHMSDMDTLQECLRKIVTKSSRKLRMYSHRIVLCVDLHDKMANYARDAEAYSTVLEALQLDEPTILS
eukprot:183962_1